MFTHEFLQKLENKAKKENKPTKQQTQGNQDQLQEMVPKQCFYGSVDMDVSGLEAVEGNEVIQR